MAWRTAWISSGVMSVTPWSAAAWPATWAKIPPSLGAEKLALQPGMTSPQAKVFIAGLLVGRDDRAEWPGVQGNFSGGRRRGPRSGAVRGRFRSDRCTGRGRTAVRADG